MEKSAQQKPISKERKAHYRDVLIHELQLRMKRNSSYSLRSFSRDLGIDPSSLSRVLSGEQGLSVIKGKQIAKKLNLNEIETAHFCKLIESKHARSQKQRELALLDLNSDESDATELSIEYFKIISDWHYFAIIELTQVKDFESSPEWIARRLGLSTETAQESIHRLLKLELIEINEQGKIQKTKDFRTTTNGIPSRAIQSYHQQILKKAELAITEQEVHERDFGAVTFALNQKDLAWAKSEIQKFRWELSKRLASAEQKDRLYQLSMQLFALDQIENKEPV